MTANTHTFLTNVTQASETHWDANVYSSFLPKPAEEPLPHGNSKGSRQLGRQITQTFIYI